MAERRPVSREAIEERYEPSDVNIRGVLITGFASLVTVVLFGLMLWGMVGLFSTIVQRPTATPVERTGLVPPEPRLQANPVYDMAVFRAREDAALRASGWVDRQAGVVQIPIDEAMAILAERGWPQPPGGTATGSAGPVPTAVVVRSGGIAGGSGAEAGGGAGAGPPPTGGAGTGDGSGGTLGRAGATAGGGPGDAPGRGATTGGASPADGSANGTDAVGGEP